MNSWNSIKTDIIEQADTNTTVKLQYIDKVEILIRKSEKVVKRLKAVCTDANMEYIINFISSFLGKIIFHRNQLKHYRSSLGMFREMFSHFIDIDFAENLSVPVKFEPQLLHWCHDQVTVHSGILKTKGEKSYHAYISDNKVHDHIFTRVAINEILEELELGG